MAFIVKNLVCLFCQFTDILYIFVNIYLYIYIYVVPINFYFCRFLSPVLHLFTSSYPSRCNLVNNLLKIWIPQLTTI